MAQRIFKGLVFSNTAIKQLPHDFSDTSLPCLVPRTTPNLIFTKTPIQPIKTPKIISISPLALQLVGLESIKEYDIRSTPTGSSDEWELISRYLSASEAINNDLDGHYYSHCYSGYQFGNFAGQLGDGAVSYVGEIINKHGDKYELQFKGSGMTAYSRSGDGRKVLRSSIREYLACEYFGALKIPTTRSASLTISNDDVVIRDQFYDGNARNEPMAVITRISRSFLRFGSFEIFNEYDETTGSQGPSHGNHSLKRQLLEFTRSAFFSQADISQHTQSIIVNNNSKDVQGEYAEMYLEIVLSTASLVAQWQSIGFCHGVLNTDNMSILGQTIDYGPFGFMEYYDPDYIPNSSDIGGRYKFSSQPKMVKWNCDKLSQAMAPQLPRKISKQILKDNFRKEYNRQYYYIMGRKLGLISENGVIEEPTEDIISIVDSFINALSMGYTDYTNSFTCLERGLANDTSVHDLSNNLTSLGMPFDDIIEANTTNIPKEAFSQLVHLFNNDPNLLRSLGVDPAQIETEINKSKKRQLLLTIHNNTSFNSPAESYNELVREKWTLWLDSYLKLILDKSAASKIMAETNPKFTLRNSVLQEVIQHAYDHDYAPLNSFLTSFQRDTLYTDDIGSIKNNRYLQVPIQRPFKLKVSCSS